MSTTVETARLELQSNAEEFAAKIAKSENALEALQTQLRLAPKDFDRIDAAMDKEVEILEEYRQKLAQVEAQMAKMDEASGKAVNKLKGLGQAGLQTGRVIQDFAQGGIGGVLNNIEGFAQAVGGGPGLAGALTGLGVAIFLVKPYIGDFIDSLSPEKPKEFTGALTALQNRIKEIGEQKIILAVDMLELDMAKKKLAELAAQQAAFDAAGSGRTADEKAAGSQFQKEFEETGGRGKAARDAVAAQITTEKNATSPTIAAVAPARDEVARLKDISERIVDKTSRSFRDNEKAIVEAEKKLTKLVDDAGKVRGENAAAAGRETGDLFAGAAAGNNPNARADLAKRFKSTGQDDFAGMVAGATPEAIAAAREEDQRIEAEDAEFERRNENAKRARLKREEKEKERLREAEAAGKAAEQDPAFKRRQAEIDKTHKGFGLTDDDAETVRLGVAKQEAADAAKEARENKLEKVPDVEQQQKAQRARQQEGLAKQIYQGSQGELGMQLTPDQAREAAKSTMDMVGKNIDFNVALQSAMTTQAQVSTQLANQLMRQQAWMRQHEQQLRQIGQFMQQPGPANLPGGR